MNEFSLPVRAGLFKNAGELRAGRRDRDATPPRRRLPAVALDDFGGEPRLGRGQAKTFVQILDEPLQLDLRIGDRDERRRQA